MVHFRRARSVLWKSNVCSRNLLGTLCVSGRSRRGAVRMWIWLAQPSGHFLGVWDRCRCAAVLILVASQRCWQRNLLEGPSRTILQGFHGRPSCMKVLTQVLVRSSCEDLIEVLSKKSLHDLAPTLMRRSCGDLGEVRSKRSLHDVVQVHEDLAEILAKSSLRGSCMILRRSLWENTFSQGPVQGHARTPQRGLQCNRISTRSSHENLLEGKILSTVRHPCTFSQKCKLHLGNPPFVGQASKNVTIHFLALRKSKWNITVSGSLPLKHVSYIFQKPPN